MKHDWNIPRVAAIFEDGDKIRLSSKSFCGKKMDGMALGWNSLPSRSKGVASWVKSRRNFSSISVIIYADESQLSDEKMGTKMALHHDDMI